VFAGNVAGSAYFVPKPEPDHGYANIYGDPKEPNTIVVPSGLKETLAETINGNVAGSAYFVPKPEPDHK
jgi:hypothetical protein